MKTMTAKLIASALVLSFLKKSLAGKGALYGFLASAIGGALWGSASQDSDVLGNGTALVAGTYVGAIGALAGLLLGSVAGLDSNFTVAGKPETAVSAY